MVPEETNLFQNEGQPFNIWEAIEVREDDLMKFENELTEKLFFLPNFISTNYEQ